MRNNLFENIMFWLLIIILAIFLVFVLLMPTFLLGQELGKYISENEQLKAQNVELTLKLNRLCNGL